MVVTLCNLHYVVVVVEARCGTTYLKYTQLSQTSVMGEMSYD